MTTHTAHLLAAEATAQGDNGFCTVVAYAIATGSTYKASFEAMKRFGREKGRGVLFSNLIDAVRYAGFTVEEIGKYEWAVPNGGREPHPNSDNPLNPLLERGWWCQGIRTPITLKQGLDKYAPNETFLISYRGHVSCAKDALIHDWASGRRLRIKGIWRVTA